MLCLVLLSKSYKLEASGLQCFCTCLLQHWSLARKSWKKYYYSGESWSSCWIQWREAYEASLHCRQAHLDAESALSADSTTENADSALVLWGYLGIPWKFPLAFWRQWMEWAVNSWFCQVCPKWHTWQNPRSQWLEWAVNSWFCQVWPQWTCQGHTWQNWLWWHTWQNPPSNSSCVKWVS